MKSIPTQACSPALLARLREKAGPDGVLSFCGFMAEALYAPGLGYYTRENRERVGRSPQADFYTSSSLSGGVFGRLVKAAAAKMVEPAILEDFTLVEIAAEPDEGVFAADPSPFASVVTKRVVDELILPENAVVFANEWLDAQPFHRLVYRHGAWRELGVSVGGDNLHEIELGEISPSARDLLKDLPSATTEDYHLDISLAAENLLEALAASPWTGCLILADYGHDWKTLTHERPAGTARAYYQHKVSGDLLDRPGEQDLTCHVCWDRLENILLRHGFASVQVERQEAFFVGNAAAEIERTMTQNAAKFSTDRQTLIELLHPAHLGQKFQILSARRRCV